MKRSLILVLSCCTLLLMPTARSHAFILPIHAILENTAALKTGLRTAVISHDIKFTEGFYSPISFGCKETIYFQSPATIRIDYVCGNVNMILVSSEKSRKIFYNQGATNQDPTPLHSFLALFLSSDANILIPSLTQSQFIQATETIENDLKTWDVQAPVSLARLGKIEKSVPLKLEKNLTYLIQSGQKLWLEKDLYVPQKAEVQGQIVLFHKYREIPLKGSKNAFRYPETVQISEADIPGVVLQTHFDEILLNPKLDSTLFQTDSFAKKAVGAFLAEESSKKEVLEKFISQYR